MLGDPLLSHADMKRQLPSILSAEGLDESAVFCFLRDNVWELRERMLNSVYGAGNMFRSPRKNRKRRLSACHERATDRDTRMARISAAAT